MIKRPLLTRAFGHNAIGETHRNLIMVTSSVEGEGKTFSSLNLQFQSRWRWTVRCCWSMPTSRNQGFRAC